MTFALFSWKKLPLFSECLLVIVLAWIVAGWILPQATIQPSNITKIMATTAISLPEINKLIAIPLFGKAPAKVQAPTIVAAPPAPVIRQALNFKLLGTVVAGKSSAAILSVASIHHGDEQVYFIGDQIQPGITLKRVEYDAITVDRNGILERISLEQGKKLTTTSMAQSMPSPSLPPRIFRPNTPSPLIQRQMNRHHLQQQLQNFPALLSQARAIPHFVNGKMQGFSITEIVPGSLYQQAGLRNNDIVISVNGEKITGAQQAMGLYSTLKSASALDLELIRASGVRETIHYDIR